VRRLRAERGAALALVTHDLNIVAKVAEHVLVMKDGRVVEQSPVSAVFRRPAVAYTRTLLEASLDLSGEAPRADATARELVSARELSFSYPGGG
jgi:peptide/nickel transport system ATP-binding protein